jgi:uncharacterized phage infection (PIP) family protein YhgE
MNPTLWLRLVAGGLLGLCLVASAADEKKDRDRDGRKRAGDAPGQAGKPAGKPDADQGKEEDGDKPKKPDVLAADLEAFRDSKDPAAMEIVALHNEIDKAYTELATARNVALGGDREAKKAERDAKTLESKIKRGLKKLESEVGKYVRPLEKDYEETKGKHDALIEKADQLSQQGQEKKAAAQEQQAKRYTGKIEGLKRQIDTVKSFLYFDSAEGIDLGGDDDGDDGGKDGKGPRDREERDKGGGMKDKPERGGKGGK